MATTTTVAMVVNTAVGFNMAMLGRHPGKSKHCLLNA